MSVNFTKNKESLLQAWSEVVDDKNAADWALFGYDGQTFDLKLVNKGDGGLEEMVDDLSSGKIMYAFCRIKDPKTSLPKFVLINWQGEGAPGDRKGKCANHVRDVSSFFKGAHLTMNARTEDDVSPEIVVEMVSKATGSVYSFTDRAGPLQDHLPVGSVYRRTIPSVEIKTSERDKFWQKEEEEEKKRVAEDRRRLDEENKKLDDDRRQREMQEASRRDKIFKEKTESINEIRAAEKKANVATAAARQKWERRGQDDEGSRSGAADRNSGDNSAIQRKEELQAMISQRTINARAIFEQNTSVGQLSSIRNGRAQPSLPLNSNSATNGVNGRHHHHNSADNSTSSVTSPPSTDSPPSYRSPVSPDVTPPSPAPESNSASYQAPATTDSSSSTSGFSYTKNLLRESQPQRQDSEDDPEEQEWGGALPEDDTPRHVPTPAPQVTIPHEREASPKPPRHQAAVSSSSTTTTTTIRTEEVNVAQVNHYQDESEQYSEGVAGEGGPMARALYDYQAADDTEISFNPDDIIVNIDQIDEGWWQGLAPDGTYGLFPANYVELID